MSNQTHQITFQIINPWPSKYLPTTRSISYDTLTEKVTEYESHERRHLLQHHLNTHPEKTPISIYETFEKKDQRFFKYLVCWYTIEVNNEIHH